MAIKAIDKRRLTDEEIDDIHNEVQMLQKCDHPNVVNYFETYDDNRFIYLCMELCRGGELLEKFTDKSKKFTEARAASVAHQLLSALNMIHSMGIIHRDIKPENIMFDAQGDDGTVKFIDFGLACQMKSGYLDCAGTPYYLAPEVLTNVYDVKCDVSSIVPYLPLNVIIRFGLGCICSTLSPRIMVTPSLSLT